MTIKEKDSLIRYLDDVVPKQCVAGRPEEIIWLATDVKAALSDFIEDDKHTTGLNYAVEYRKLMDEHKKLDGELHHWQTIAAQNTEELQKLRLIIKTIEFVTGRELEY